MKYVALLRGINVGGNNIIKMAALKACFEKLGFKNVVTFIQSGNVIFDSPVSNNKAMTEKIEAALSKTFKYTSLVVLVSFKSLKHTVEKAPKGFGTKPVKYRYDVIFLRAPLSTKEAIKSLSVNKEVDQAFEGKEVLYFSRLTSKASKSRLSKIVLSPIYKSITIRNWNTTTKLLGLMGNN